MIKIMSSPNNTERWSDKAQEDFLGIPKSAQDIIVNHYHDVANVLNNPDIVDIDTENYGAPPQNSGIAAYKK
jgi:hypothetical protein